MGPMHGHACARRRQTGQVGAWASRIAMHARADGARAYQLVALKRDDDVARCAPSAKERPCSVRRQSAVLPYGTDPAVQSQSSSVSRSAVAPAPVLPPNAVLPHANAVLPNLGRSELGRSDEEKELR